MTSIHLFIYVTLGLSFSSLFFDDYALAQIEADQTLPVPTNVNLSGNTFEINNGTNAGNNLFHSFKEFSIPTGRVAKFINNNPVVENVFARITGKTESNIAGLIQVGGASPYFNLFLINSNGILFGSQSSLDLKGSFVATTANAIEFEGKGFFDTSSSKLTSNNPLTLTVKPSAFFFSQARSQPISYKSTGEVVTGLTVPVSNSILFLGGDIELNGGILNAENGRIEIGGLATAGTVKFSINQGEINLDFPQKVALANVSFTNGAFINVQGSGSGNISVNANDINVTDGSIILSGISPQLVSDTLKSGKILINATGAVNVDNFSAIASISYGSGDSGDVILKANSLKLTNISEISSRIFAEKGNSGNIEFNITDGITISGSDEVSNSSVATATNKVGSTGRIEINSGWLSLTDGAAIRNSVLGNGSTGDIIIHSEKFIAIENSSQQPITQIRTLLEPGAVGNGGNINIYTRSLYLTGGGQLLTSVSGADLENMLPGGKGKGGNINIEAIDSVIISGVSPDKKFASGIFADAEPGADGSAGNTHITTNSLSVADGGEIKVSNPQGQAGTLTINANSLTLDKGRIIAETGGNAISNSANIDLNISDILRIENESLISAKATDKANGGNIKIDTPILLALSPTGFEGSDIKANAERGAGGNISINAQGIFGIEQRKVIDGNQTNDIDASSQFGQSGQVQINTTTDPNQGLVELPATVVDPSTLVAQNPCKRASSSEFTRSGRGGLPPSLSQDLNGESIQVGLVEPANVSADKPESKSDFNQASAVAQPSSQIAPAQGWVYNSKGEVVLVAYNSAVTASQRLQTAPAGCPVF